MSSKLDQTNAFIFRIVHRDNIPWILKNGLYCRNASKRDSGYIPIGNPELIEKRNHKTIPNQPGKTLSDYVPFYFTPFTPMMYNIKTGYSGVQKRKNAEIIILASSIPTLHKKGLSFLFTDRHAYLETAEFYSEMADLGKIDWVLLQKRDFKRDLNDPGKVERYQAEALIYKHLPVNALLGMACHDEETENYLKNLLKEHEIDMKIHKQPGWYF
jgi:hypothetical protein